MKDSVALVTGAADGIGKSTAIEFSRRGTRTVICDVQEEKLHEVARAIEDEGGSVMCVRADISKPKEVEEMIRRTLDAYGQLDIACNNAGISGDLAETVDYTLEGWDKVMNVNLRGQFLCMKYELPGMLERGKGSIINISSILGKVGFAQAPAYTAAKHGLIGLTKTAALEYSGRGVRINAICPAFIVTPMLEKAGITTDEEASQQAISLHPIGRMGQPEEVAKAIVWLASDEASFVTGHSLLVDGGYTAR